MHNILIVGNITKDVYLRLDNHHNHFETDANGVSWLDLAFNGSSHRFFSRTSIYGGAAVSYEVLTRFGLKPQIPATPIDFIDGQITVKNPPTTYRYILSKDDNISYLTPSNPENTNWQLPDTAPDWIYIDRSAKLSPELCQQILNYLNLGSHIQLAVFISKRVNQTEAYVQELLARASLIIADTPLKSQTSNCPVVTITPEHIRLNQQRIHWSLHEKQDLMTHLTAHLIIAATILAALALGRSESVALLLARANVDQASLEGTSNLDKLEDDIFGEEYRIELVDQKDNQAIAMREIAQKLLAPHKGILAADESGGSIHKKFATLNIPDDFTHRRDYRNIFFTTPDLEKYISGVILFDETARQTADNGQDFVTFLSQKGIIPGIKVDQGLEPIANSTETYTKGLTDLPIRLSEYYKMGARFAKWRAAFNVSRNTPSDLAIRKNAEILADYAKACQEANIVPIVEPELVYDGYYSLTESAHYTGKILDALFTELKNRSVDLSACILKVNMVLAGKQYETQSTPQEVGQATASVLRAHVPETLAGVVFLSGGQSMEQATANLQAITNAGPFPWPVTFSFARALQDAALFAWQGNNANADNARRAFQARLIANTEALNKQS